MSRSRSQFIAWVTLSYIGLALAWIFLSDRLLAALVDVQELVWLSTAKGVFFVAVSAAMFFLALQSVPAAMPHEQRSPWDTLVLTAISGRRARWLIYGLAVMLPVLTLVLRQGIHVSPEHRPMLILFVFPSILCALLGGWGPGLLATLTSMFCVLNYTFARPCAQIPTHDMFNLGMLVFNGLAVSLLGEMLRGSLRRSQAQAQLLDAVVSGTSDAIFVKDPQGRYLMANEAVARFVGKPLEEIVGQDDRSLFPQPTASEVMQRDAEVMAGGQIQLLEEPVTAHDGRQLVFLVTKGPLLDPSQRVLGMFGIARDITERKQAETMALAREAELRETQRLAGVGSWEWPVATRQQIWSDEIFRIYGRDPALGVATEAEIKALFTRDSWLRMNAAVRRALNEGQPYECDAELLRPDGQQRWIVVRGEPVFDDQGRVIRLRGTVQDMTERYQSAHRLRENEERLRLTLEATSDGVWDWDLRSGYAYRSPQYYQLIGYTPEEDTHDFEFFRRLVDPRDRDQVLTAVQAHRQGQTATLIVEFRLIKRNGEVCWMQARGRAVERDEKGQALRMVGTLTDLTEQHRKDALLRDREQQLARVIEGSDLGFWDWNLQTNEFVVSARWETMLGFEPGEMDVRVENWPQLVNAEDLTLAQASIERHLAGLTTSHELELRMRTKLGDWRWVLTRGRIVSRSEDGRPLIMAGTHTDIHERKTMELAQREASTVFARSDEGIMVVSPQMRIIRVNPAFTRITGYEADEVQGQSPGILSSGQHGSDFYAAIWNTLKHEDFWRGEIINRRKSGEHFTELLSIAAVRDARGELQHYVGVFSDISQIKSHEAEKDRIAHYDPLTGLPNRRLLADRLGQGIAHANSRGRMLAVCFLDLDGFKAINDAHGHDSGDSLLIGVAENLKQTLRADDTLARVGGDEFVLLLTNLGSHEECTRVLDRVLQAASMTVQVGDKALWLSASIGVATYPADDADADTLLRHADQAMYLAKEAGKNRYMLFDPENDRRAQEHRKVLQSLQLALHQQEFVLHYQPKVDLVSGEIVGVEALLRWQPPGQPLVAPGEFLPHVAGSELEQPLGHWVVTSALQQAQQWQREGLCLTVSINISANHLLRPGFCRDLQAALQRCPEVDPARIELEVLESAAIADMTQAVGVMKECRALGVRFALDDFGTGYSSLTYLRKLPVDILKIDQSFVRDMLVDAEDLGIVEGVIRLARAFNREVIAEGVETMEHGTTLARMGCRLVQGFGIARPMPAADIRSWADGWKINQPWLRLPHGHGGLIAR